MKIATYQTLTGCIPDCAARALGQIKPGVGVGDFPQSAPGPLLAGAELGLKVALCYAIDSRRHLVFGTLLLLQRRAQLSPAWRGSLTIDR